MLYVELAKYLPANKCWKATSRWVQFEEELEESNKWGKAHVALLAFHNFHQLLNQLAKSNNLKLHLFFIDLPFYSSKFWNKTILIKKYYFLKI